MSELSIEIVMIYERDSNTDTDNIVRIRKNLATNEFEIRYTDPNEGTPIRHQITGLYHQKVLDYIYYLMKNQYLDEQGFTDFQVNIPGMPRMIVSGTAFKQVYYREHFYELLGYALDNLENTTRVTVPRFNTNVPTYAQKMAYLSRNSTSQTNQVCETTSSCQATSCCQATECEMNAYDEDEDGEVLPRHQFF